MTSPDARRRFSFSTSIRRVACRGSRRGELAKQKDAILAVRSPLAFATWFQTLASFLFIFLSIETRRFVSISNKPPFAAGRRHFLFLRQWRPLEREG